MQHIDRNRLRSSIRKESDSMIFKRGELYFRQGRASSPLYKVGDKSSLDVEGVVRGSKTYKVRITIDESDSSIADYSCNCPYEYGMCKHVVALGLSVVDTLEDNPSYFEDTKSLQVSQDGDSHPMDTQTQTVLQKLKELGIDGSLLSQDLVQKIVEAIKTTASKDSQDKKSGRHPIEEYTPQMTKSGRIHMVRVTGEEQRKKVEPKPKPIKLFSERYYISLGSSYRGRVQSVQLYGIQSKSSWRYSLQEISASGLLTSKETFTSEQIDFLIQLNEWKKQEHPYEDVDNKAIVPLLLAARALNVRLEVVRDYGNVSTLSWVEPEKIHIAFAQTKETSLYGEYDYSRVSVDFSESLIEKSGPVVCGDEGVIIVQKNSIAFHPLPILLSVLIVRAVKENYHNSYGYGMKKIEEKMMQTFLLDSEYEHLDIITTLAQEYLTCESALEKSFVIEKYKPVPIIVVDYKSHEGTLLVLPSIDYGGVVLHVCDTSYFSTANLGGVVRRKDAAFGTSHVVRVIDEKVIIAPVIEKIEMDLYNLGYKRGLELGISKKGRESYRGQKQILHFIEQYLPKIKNLPYEIRYPNDIPQEVITTEVKANFDIDFNADNDWLAFDLMLYCGDERVQLSDIESCLYNDNSQVTLPDGRIMRITNREVLQRLVELIAHFRKNDSGAYEGKTYHAPELDAVARGSLHYSTRVSKSFESFVTEAKRGKVVKTIKIPKTFSNVLREYQVEGVHWLHFLHQYRFAGVLSDDMGLGKTLQALAILSIHAQKGKASLIVVPKTLLHNWEQEVTRFAPHLKTVVIDGVQTEREASISNMTKYDLVITSYPMLKRDIETYEKYNAHFNYTVLDEAQYVKNPHTKSSHIVRRIKSDYRLALTGTPLENSVKELWSLFDFLMPGFLGHHAFFQKSLGNPIMKLGDQRALSRLRTKIACFMLRRTKEEVLTELPPKVEQAISCNLSDEQNLLYQDVLKRVRKDITAQVKKEGFAASQIHILAGLTKLRQICNHPALVLPTKKRGSYPSAKLEACMEIIKEMHAQKRKVLVFSQFTKMLDILGDALTKKKIPYAYLSGKTKDRKGVVDLFIQDKSIPVFLISTKAGGVGLNLTAADAVIIFDPWWNPQVERQAVDRTHRIGQTKSVNVYRLRTTGTIEEKILHLQERKQKLFEALVGDSKDMFKKLTWDDVKLLLVN